MKEAGVSDVLTLATSSQYPQKMRNQDSPCPHQTENLTCSTITNTGTDEGEKSFCSRGRSGEEITPERWIPESKGDSRGIKRRNRKTKKGQRLSQLESTRESLLCLSWSRRRWRRFGHARWDSPAALCNHCLRHIFISTSVDSNNPT